MIRRTPTEWGKECVVEYCTPDSKENRVIKIRRTIKEAKRTEKGDQKPKRGKEGRKRKGERKE